MEALLLQATAADGAFIGVAISSGEHSVTFHFVPLAFRWGIPLFGLGVLFLFGAYFLRTGQQSVDEHTDPAEV